jgi:hypothetical protein
MHSRPARILFTIADLLAWPACAVSLLVMGLYPFTIGMYLARKGITVPAWMLTAQWLGWLLLSVGLMLSLRRTPFSLVPLSLSAFAFAVARDWPFALSILAYAAVLVALPHVLAMRAFKASGGQP